MCRSRNVGISLALVVLVGASRQAQAQDGTSTQPSPRVSVGGFWNANIANVAVSPSPGDVKARQWTGGGVTVHVPLSGIFSLDARAMWNRKGARLPVKLPGASGFQDVSVAYVSLPVLVKASMRGSVRPYLVDRKSVV